MVLQDLAMQLLKVPGLSPKTPETATSTTATPVSISTSCELTQSSSWKGTVSDGHGITTKHDSMPPSNGGQMGGHRSGAAFSFGVLGA